MIRASMTCLMLDCDVGEWQVLKEEEIFLECIGPILLVHRKPRQSFCCMIWKSLNVDNEDLRG